MPPNSRSQKQALRFGVFQVNLTALELRKHGVRVRLRGQPFRILALLLERPGEILTREELQQRLWPSDTFVDFEHGLNSAIKKLRAALGDSADNPRYIETLPRVGYRFIAPVEELLPAVPAEVLENQSAPAETESQEQVVAEAAARSRIPLSLGLAAILVVVLSFYLFRARSKAPVEPAGDRMMLAVLPFENLTGDPEQDFFCEGLTEEMITQLGHLDPEHLGVIAHASVLRYKTNPKPPDQVGGELGVQYVLEGSVLRSGDKIRVTAKLIYVKDQSSVWARQYDRDAGNPLLLQSGVSQAIADEIDLILGRQRPSVRASAPRSSPKSYEAYEAYLKGIYFWNKRTEPGFRQAVEFFQRAIALDPGYARAYAGLANCYAMMSSYQYAPQNEFVPKAREAALRALQIDESLADAHTALGVIAQNYDWDWQTAEKEFRRAIELDPNYPTAHQWYAESLSFQGRLNEAFTESERARRLDPLSLIIAADHGAILYFSKQYDRAIEQFRTVLEMEPTFPRAHLIVYAYVQKRQFDEALADVQSWRRHEDLPAAWALEAYTYGRWGKQKQAREALEQLLQRSRDLHMVPTSGLIVAYIGMGRNDDAIAILQKAYAQHSNLLTGLKADPLYDPLRGDPRFQKLLQQVGLSAPSNAAPADATR